MLGPIEPFSYKDIDGRTIDVVYNGKVRAPWTIIDVVEWDGISNPDQNQDIIVGLYQSAKYNDRSIKQKLCELSYVTSMLLTHGYINFKLTGLCQECPDVKVEFENGDLAFVEVAEVVPTDSAKFSSMIKYLNQKMQERHESDNELQDVMSNHKLHFRAFPRVGWEYNGNKATEEINHFLDSRVFETTEFSMFHPIGSHYPLLTKIDTRYWFTSVRHRTIPLFQLDAFAYGLDDSDQTVIDRINDKVAKAATYTGSPLWLVLYINDQETVAMDNLHSIKNHAFNLGPFKKLFVGDDWYSLCYTINEHMALNSVRREAGKG